MKSLGLINFKMKIGIALFSMSLSELINLQPKAPTLKIL